MKKYRVFLVAIGLLILCAAAHSLAAETPAVTEKRLAAFLMEKLPELQDMEKQLVKASGGKSQLAIYVDTAPDPKSQDRYERDYYLMNIDRKTGNDLWTLDQFFVHKELKDVLWFDEDQNKYLTLDEWRKIVAAKPYWPKLFK